MESWTVAECCQARNGTARATGCNAERATHASRGLVRKSNFDSTNRSMYVIFVVEDFAAKIRQTKLDSNKSDQLTEKYFEVDEILLGTC